MSNRRLTLWLAPLVVALAAGAGRAQDMPGKPLSAIDWLSESVARPPPTMPEDGPQRAEGAGRIVPIIVTQLGGPDLDAVGLLPPSVTGLPADLWGSSRTEDLVRLIRESRAHALPALQSLFQTLLLAEFDPPANEPGEGSLLLARLDKLLDMGALDQAQALLERAGPTDPALFRRWFDVSLLTGHENRACATMRATPGIAPTFPARIFCLARGGDWNAAALTLETGTALGFIAPEMDALLLRFLEPDYADPSDPLPIPARPSPLVFRMMEAIGQPIPTGSLPLAFAHADLRNTSGWKARIEAAERLARAGILSENRLLGIYTEREPAASGGIWDRVGAVQAFDIALLSGSPDAITKTLRPAWNAMKAAGLAAPFARLYGARLARTPLPPEAAALAFRIGLLSKDYEAVAAAYEPRNAEETLLRALARGDAGGLSAADPRAAAVIRAFGPVDLGPAMRLRLEQGHLGEAILHAIDRIAAGMQGEIEDVTEGLALLRRVGLETTARRAALELLVLGRRR